MMVVILTVMIDSMGIGIVIPVTPALLMDVLGATLAEAAIWGHPDFIIQRHAISVRAVP